MCYKNLKASLFQHIKKRKKKKRKKKQKYRLFGKKKLKFFNNSKSTLK